MTHRYIVAFMIFLLSGLALKVQAQTVEVDYNHPKKYFVGGVSVEGNSYFSSQQIIQLTGLQKGMELTVPSDDVAGIVRRLWLQRYFEDVSVSIDSLSAAYPLFPAEGFQAVADTYATFPNLYDNVIETPMTPFLQQQLRTDDLWQPLRNNFKTRELFVHACHERVDGLRILQFLKSFNLRPAEEELRQWGTRHQLPIKEDLNFATSPIAEINNLRNSIFELEAQLRRHCDASPHDSL